MTDLQEALETLRTDLLNGFGLERLRFILTGDLKMLALIGIERQTDAMRLRLAFETARLGKPERRDPNDGIGSALRETEPMSDAALREEFRASSAPCGLCVLPASCTRPLGHTGDHVAIGPGARWPRR